MHRFCPAGAQVNWLTSRISDDWRSLGTLFKRYSVRLAAAVALLSGLATQQQGLILNLLAQLPANAWERVPITLVTMLLVFGVPTLAVLWKQPNA